MVQLWWPFPKCVLWNPSPMSFVWRKDSKMSKFGNQHIATFFPPHGGGDIWDLGDQLSFV
jgi:hypothetical protein